MYKLLWVTEDAKGFYFGQYGPTDDDGVGGGPHQSYHADGKRHYRLRRSREPLQERYDTPIGDVTDVRSLGTHAIAFEPKALEALGADYDSEDPKAALSIFLEGASFATWAFNLHSSLFHRSREPEWVGSILSQVTARSGAVLAAFAIPLQNFPDHKVGLVFVNYATSAKGNRERDPAE